MSNLVKKKAPDFTAQAVWNKKIIDKFTLSQFKGKYVILFFYPLDFTFVCPTELIAFQASYQAFVARDTQLIACSVDSVYAHLSWLSMPQKTGGIEGISYPIVSDLNKTIARDYDVLVPEEGIAFRALFLIDRSGIVRHCEIWKVVVVEIIDDNPFRIRPGGKDVGCPEGAVVVAKENGHAVCRADGQVVEVVAVEVADG